jgi:hypothetical protein
LEGIEEHRLADFAIERIQGLDPQDETYDAKFKVLKESVLHPIKEEEKSMFPECNKALSTEELDRLGQEMEALEQQLK